MSLSEHWASVYWMLSDNAFDYSQVLRVGEDEVIVDGVSFFRPEF